MKEVKKGGIDSLLKIVAICSLLVAVVLFIVAMSGPARYKGDVEGLVKYAQGVGEHAMPTVEFTGYANTGPLKEGPMFFVRNGVTKAPYAVVYFESDIQLPADGSRVTIRGKLFGLTVQPDHVSVMECEIVD